MKNVLRYSREKGGPGIASLLRASKLWTQHRNSREMAFSLVTCNLEFFELAYKHKGCSLAFSYPISSVESSRDIAAYILPHPHCKWNSFLGSQSLYRCQINLVKLYYGQAFTTHSVRLASCRISSVLLYKRLFQYHLMYRLPPHPFSLWQLKNTEATGGPRL